MFTLPTELYVYKVHFHACYWYLLVLPQQIPVTSMMLFLFAILFIHPIIYVHVLSNENFSRLLVSGKHGMVRIREIDSLINIHQQLSKYSELMHDGIHTNE